MLEPGMAGELRASRTACSASPLDRARRKVKIAFRPRQCNGARFLALDGGDDALLDFPQLEDAR